MVLAASNHTSMKSHCFGRTRPAPFRRGNAACVRSAERASTAAASSYKDSVSTPISSTSTSAGSTGSSKRHLLLAGLAAATASLAAVPAASLAKSSSGDWSSPGLAAPEDPAIPKFFKTANGVKVQEMVAGTSGPEVQPGDAVLVDYVLR